MIPRYFIVAERDHELQNPTSEEKLELLGRRLRLGPSSRVLDIASGRGGGPALVFAEKFGCRIEGIEIAPEFHAALSSARVSAGSRVWFTLGDASLEALPAGEYDAALCLGASFVYGSLADTVEAPAAPERLQRTRRPLDHAWRHRPRLRDLWPSRRLGTRILGGRLGPVRDPPLARRRGIAGGEPGRRGRRRHLKPERALEAHVSPPWARVPGLGDLHRLEGG